MSARFSDFADVDELGSAEEGTFRADDPADQVGLPSTAADSFGAGTSSESRSSAGALTQCLRLFSHSTQSALPHASGLRSSVHEPVRQMPSSVPKLGEDRHEARLVACSKPSEQLIVNQQPLEGGRVKFHPIEVSPTAAPGARTSFTLHFETPALDSMI